eukprot:symbB.v1.2.006542.t1/scaffold388.1/size215153/3
MMVSTLILAACGALFFACRLGRGEIGVDMKTTADLKSSIEDWEQIPGIDDVIAHAKTLELKQPLRRLDDLFYDSQPTEKPWIRTECVIDVVQAAAYLGQAVVFLYKAIDYPGLKCPDDSPVGCAASVAGFITSALGSMGSQTHRIYARKSKKNKEDKASSSKRGKDKGKDKAKKDKKKEKKEKGSDSSDDGDALPGQHALNE